MKAIPGGHGQVCEISVLGVVLWRLPSDGGNASITPKQDGHRSFHDHLLAFSYNDLRLSSTGCTGMVTLYCQAPPRLSEFIEDKREEREVSGGVVSCDVVSCPVSSQLLSPSHHPTVHSRIVLCGVVSCRVGR
jgi:hypothetical protein